MTTCAEILSIAHDLRDDIPVWSTPNREVNLLDVDGLNSTGHGTVSALSPEAGGRLGSRDLWR